jgi:adenylate kinase
MGLYIILLGVQGSGKGEQAKFISQHYGIPQVSTGDLFRAMKTRTDDLAKRVQGIMAAGKLVDDDTTNEILVERLALPDAQNGVILDGYPRTPAQADFLSNYLLDKGEKLTTVLLLDLELYVAFKRAFGRVKAADGDTFNYYYRPEGVTFKLEYDVNKQYPPRLGATLDKNGEVLERRTDDADAFAIIKRIDTYLETTKPLIEYYRERGLLQPIDAAQPIEDVSRTIQHILDRLRT